MLKFVQSKALEKIIRVIKKNLFNLDLNLSPIKIVFLHFNKNLIKTPRSINITLSFTT